MKRTMIALLVALTLGSGMNLSARDKKTNNAAPTDRKEMSTRMATRKASELKLDDNTQAWFIPLYAEYQDTLRAVKRMGMPEMLNKDEKASNKAKEPKKLTDAEALQRIETIFSNEEKELSLKRAYYTRFKEKLTPQQLLSIFGQQTRPAMPQGFRRQGDNRQMPGMPGNDMNMGGFGGPGFGD